jgi:hypothetical protein
MGKNKDRVLRFAVTGALLVGAPAMACGGGETHSNEPAPEHTNEPAMDDTSGDEMGAEGEGGEAEPQPTVNEPEPGPEDEEEDPMHSNELPPE